MNLITIVLSILLFVLFFLFLMRSKLISLMSASLKITFFVLLITALSGLFTPQLYTMLADLTLKQTGTLETLQMLDEQFIINDIAETSEDLLQDIENFFTGDEEESTDEQEQGGIFERNIYPGLVKLIASIYRILATFLSIIGLIVIVYLSYATSGAGDIQKLKSRVVKLEERLKQLEGEPS